MALLNVVSMMLAVFPLSDRDVAWRLEVQLECKHAVLFK